jgi:hypothetical protein
MRISRTVTNRAVPTPRELAAIAWTWVRRCPLTAAYLLVLVVVAVVLALLPAQVADQVVYNASTNLQGLRNRPLLVLVASAFVLLGGLVLAVVVLRAVASASATSPASSTEERRR